MIIEKAIREFTEKYNDEMIMSIDKLSKELGYKENGFTMNAVDIKESTDQFKTFIEGYADYQKKNIDNDKAESLEAIKEQTNKFIDKKLFNETKVPYPELPAFVESYINSINDMQAAMENVKYDMMVTGVNQDAIGLVNEFVDIFTEKMQGRFYPIMENVLWASGYKANERLSKDYNRTKAPIFL